MEAKSSQLTPESDGLAGKRVLLIGYRQPIAEVLERLQIPFAVWHDQDVKRKLSCLKTCSAPFPATSKGIRDYVSNELSELGQFTDVIAGSEASVYVASVCRRAVQARKSKDSVALSCSDKLKMKSLMRENNIPMTEFLAPTEASSYDEIFEQLGPIVVVKQRKNSGGRGLSIARSVEQLAERTEKGLLYERHIDANEISIESFINDGEIKFTSETNYLVKSHANIVPANVPQVVLEKAHAINRDVIAALNLKWGLTHAEFYWSDEKVLFGEVALRPPGGYIMDCISMAHQFDAWEAFVANELGWPFSFPENCERTSGVAMLHAGAGTLQSILNQEEVSQLPSSARMKILVKTGDQISAREGVGEISAYGLFVSDSLESTMSDVLSFLDRLKFEVE